MSVEISTYEQALRDWRDAQTKVEALKQFRANGGEHRLKIEADDRPVIANVMDAFMRGAGYRHFLDKAIQLAQAEADDAATKFKVLAMADIPSTDDLPVMLRGVRT